MATALPVLWQFRHSHFNEKARWALDWRRLSHVRRSLLPVLHLARVLALTGQKSVPVLVVDGRAIHDSTRIIEELPPGDVGRGHGVASLPWGTVCPLTRTLGGVPGLHLSVLDATAPISLLSASTTGEIDGQGDPGGRGSGTTRTAHSRPPAQYLDARS